jgi:hypothetical protein
MLGISIKIEMPDFDRHEIEIDCPVCKLGNWVKLGEIRRREYSICRGCHSNIFLEDHMGGIQRFTRQLIKIFKDFK